MARSLGYRRILVPVRDNPESEQAMDVACRLAAEHGAVVTAVTVVEVPALLPLDAHMGQDEQDAHRLLERAGAIADLYGVGVRPRIVRARDAAGAILDLTEVEATEIVVIGAPRTGQPRTGARILGSTVQHVLERARCRVLVIGSRPAAARAAATAA